MFKPFQFRKFKPTQEITLYANTMLYQALNHLRDVDELVATMTKVRDRYFCFLEIQSKWGHFYSDAAETDPQHAIDQLDQKLRTEILKSQQPALSDFLQHLSPSQVG